MPSTGPVGHLDSIFNIDPEADATQDLCLNEEQMSADDSIKEFINTNPFPKDSTRKINKKNMKKKCSLTDTPVKELITADIKAVSAKKALVLQEKLTKKQKACFS